MFGLILGLAILLLGACLFGSRGGPKTDSRDLRFDRLPDYDEPGPSGYRGGGNGGTSWSDSLKAGAASAAGAVAAGASAAAQRAKEASDRKKADEVSRRAAVASDRQALSRPAAAAGAERQPAAQNTSMYRAQT
eukprot:scaffold32532_cov56-Isochrysis_galbana.AAC.1